jgi:hypothetical protein
MRGREFLDLARELLAWGGLPRHWRAVIIHAYYGLSLECRDALDRWGLPPVMRHQAHAQVRLRFVRATDTDLNAIGDKLDLLGRHRNWANYDLRPQPLFATSADARDDVRKATDALVVLDAIDGDPVRRAAATASIRP